MQPVATSACRSLYLLIARPRWYVVRAQLHEEEFHEDFPFQGDERPTVCRRDLPDALFSTYSTSAQQTKGKGKGKAAAKATANPKISYPGYITGTVTSEKGPEAGVWVIAETKDLRTKMIKTVVTDDQGRYLLPELPAVNYKVWVRGYGIVDSTPIDAKPSANRWL